jgi:hypothetical protein
MQRRKDADASPYINHPLALTNLLAHEGRMTDTATLCAALLHDMIEDTETRPDERMNFSTPEKRKRLKRYEREREKAFDDRLNGRSNIPNSPPWSEDLTDMRCGARTRNGTPCKQKAIYSDGRCKFHGGLSTGPMSAEGKKRSSLNGRLPQRSEKKRTP